MTFLDEALLALPPAAAMVGAPAWAVAMQQNMQAMTQQLTQLTQQQMLLTQRFSDEASNLRAFVSNGRTRASGIIAPMVDRNGVVPPNFPPTWQALQRLGAAAADELLTAFGLPLQEANGVPMTLAGKRRALKELLGFSFRE